MSGFAAVFRSDPQRHDGVRPIQVFFLRLLYALMAVFVATDAWKTILTHSGPWDPLRAVAICVWATYPLLSLLGLVHPLRMLPLVLFMISYKLLWLIVVALPLWRAHALVGSPSAEMASVFSGIWFPILIVPWGYVFRTFVVRSRKAAD